jgi:hypothetical protein
MEAFRAFLATRVAPGAEPGYVLARLRAEFASDAPGHAEALRLVLLAELRRENDAAREREAERRLRERLREIAEEAALLVGEAVYEAGVGTIEELLAADPLRLEDVASHLSEKWEVPLTAQRVLAVIGWP